MHILRRCDRNEQTTHAVICFPPAAGGIASFAAWHELWPDGIAQFVVCLAGRDHRRQEPLSEDLQAAAREVATELREIEGDLGAVTFFGHSLGALLAYEVAHQATCDQLQHLFVAACAAPQLGVSHESLSNLSPETFLLRVKERYGGIDGRLLGESDWAVEIIPRLRADLRMAEAYITSVRPLEIPITAVGGTDDSTVSPAELLAWREQTNCRFQHRWLPGGHFFPQTGSGNLLRLLMDTIDGP